jgi:xanthine dehydrogenase accessory factor
VTVEATDDPESLIDAAAADTCFLVMTHSHALDQALAERILRRGDFRYFGLIGSATKRRSFEQRLQQRGIAAALLQRMTCPIGVRGIEHKEPAAIAIAVAAEPLGLSVLGRQ